MKKSWSLLQVKFISSSGKTAQYKTFHRTWKREFKKYLVELGATEIEISKPNHFDVTGFFTLGGQIWYFSLGDLRWYTTFLIRKANSYKDYGGAHSDNQYSQLNGTLQQFKLTLEKIIL